MYSFHYVGRGAGENEDKLEPEMRERALSLLEYHLQTVDENSEDANSEFRQNIAPLSHLRPREMIYLLVDQGFDSLLCINEKDIAGFIALRWDRQTQQPTVHVYRMHTEEQHRRKGVAVEGMARIVQDAFSNGYSAIQAGKGRNESMTRILESLKRQYAQSLEIDIDLETGRITKLNTSLA